MPPNDPKEHGERLAGLDTDVKWIRDTIVKMSSTLERLADNDLRLKHLEEKMAEIRGSMEALDTDYDSLDRRLNEREKAFERLQAELKAQWRIIATLATAGAFAGGLLAQIFF